MSFRSFVAIIGVLGASTLTAAVSMSAGEVATSALALGASAPKAAVKMKSVDGRQFSITDVRGKHGTLVIFTCNACPWAQAWESRIVEIGNAGIKQGVGVIAINPNDPKKVREDDYANMKVRAKERGMQFPYVVDATSDVARAFGATRTPEAFLFDAEGKLVYHGTIDDNAREPEKVQARFLTDAVTAVASGAVPAVQETKSLGCSIKFRSKS
ncbi:MAG TPA: thioredoxin family protein [Candidatus Limnocylindria bacterium]|nr:thioredoxin family protein [Candidatus Limnocylindria bacterium]